MVSPEREELLEGLASVGLEPEEAQLYLHLVAQGPSKASEVAKGLPMSRAETYRKLQTLVRKGYASATLHRPTQFVAAAPAQFMQILIDHQEALLDRMRSVGAQLTRALAHLRPVPADAAPHEETFRIVTGRREFYRLAAQMARRAQREFAFLNTTDGGAEQADKAGFWTVLANRARSGLATKLVLRGGEDAKQRVKEVSDVPNLSLHALQTETPIRFAIADARELLISVIIEPVPNLTAKADVSIHTDASDFVGTLREFFDVTWEEDAIRPLPLPGLHVDAARLLGAGLERARPPARAPQRRDAPSTPSRADA